MSDIIDNTVRPKEVYRPDMITTRLLKTWAMQCGKCSKDFVRFAIFGRPKCPYCGVKNAPHFTTYY